MKHAFINPKNAKKNGKLGVAESSKEEVLNALENIATFNKNKKLYLGKNFMN